MKKLLYIMDPMCSWCWAFSPTVEAVQETFPKLPIQFIMGGLAADSEAPMPKEQQQAIRSIWEHIEETTGTQFNFDFWTQCLPRRSTWRACRAVIIAEQLSPGSAARMAHAIQHAYYLQAHNPSDSETLIPLADSLGINPSDFASLLDAQKTQQTLQEHMSLARQLEASGFPALRLFDGEKTFRLSDGYSKPDRIIKALHQLGASE